MEEEASRYVERIELCCTPKHGSWLNVAECEFSCLVRQCLAGRRLGELCVLQKEIGAWSTDLNDQQRGVHWQMTLSDARCKLKSMYPRIIL